jgi:hypothetical protein
LLCARAGKLTEQKKMGNGENQRYTMASIRF